MIRVPQVRVVDEDGSQLGVMHTADALRLAQERGLDLVEVAPMAAPPVTRLLDFGQYKYELTKREKEAKRKQRSVSFKEVRLKPKIGIGDFDTKVRRAISFLEDGDRIKVAVQFRGRELTHPQIGRDLLTRFADQIKDHGVVERAPVLEGKSMHISVASTHKPKSHEAAAAPAAPAAPAARSQARAPAPEAATTGNATTTAEPAATIADASAVAVAPPAATTEDRPEAAAPAVATTAQTPAAATPANGTEEATTAVPAAPAAAPEPAPHAPAETPAPTGE